jgi:hypothetical protein
MWADREVQAGLSKANSRAPTGTRINFHISIHIDDVMVRAVGIGRDRRRRPLA